MASGDDDVTLQVPTTVVDVSVLAGRVVGLSILLSGVGAAIMLSGVCLGFALASMVYGGGA